MENMASLALKNILQEFPKSMKFCFAYGSGAFKQMKSDPTKNMLDLIFVVRNSSYWHTENLAKNSHHYALPLRYLGPNIVAKVQENWGANIYYNTLIKTTNNRLIKYGVISEKCFVEDLLDWNSLYLAGRLHKPVQVIVKPDENSPIQMALNQNLKSAVHAALLLLPENFTENDFFKVITGLSYHGDFRMIFGEDKSKIDNIVMPQMDNFRELYSPILKHFEYCVDIPKNQPADMIICHQDSSPSTKIHHLNQLPRMPQVKLVRKWSQGPRSKDMEDCLRAIAHDPDCSEILQQALCDIVWRSSITQSLKGIITAGFMKSIKYSSAKIMKMMKSNNEKKKQQLSKLPQSPKSISKINNITEKDIENKNTSINTKASDNKQEHAP
ncbi:hypothetical protein PV328_005253 [Microctonus aethiopoides]|uniref:Phosphatidate cytidylyltransferase, mitochondrial n=1 Tax=Microctonus aethiopoides TaxID=144406 RepID=A0AA39FM11_9HYME|nr:hypothetical protein PV328_005253 [Microctonus aethiopoides]